MNAALRNTEAVFNADHMYASPTSFAVLAAPAYRPSAVGKPINHWPAIKTTLSGPPLDLHQTQGLPRSTV